MKAPQLQFIFVSFCRCVKYMAPEILLSIFNHEYSSGPKVDVWSLGVILVELVFNKELWPTLKLSQCLRKVVSFIYCDDVLSRFARELDNVQIYEVRIVDKPSNFDKSNDTHTSLCIFSR